MNKKNIYSATIYFLLTGCAGTNFQTEIEGNNYNCLETASLNDRLRQAQFSTPASAVKAGDFIESCNSMVALQLIRPAPTKSEIEVTGGAVRALFGKQARILSETSYSADSGSTFTCDDVEYGTRWTDYRGNALEVTRNDLTKLGECASKFSEFANYVEDFNKRNPKFSQYSDYPQYRASAESAKKSVADISKLFADREARDIREKEEHEQETRHKAAIDACTSKAQYLQYTDAIEIASAISLKRAAERDLEHQKSVEAISGVVNLTARNYDGEAIVNAKIEMQKAYEQYRSDGGTKSISEAAKIKNPCPDAPL